MSFFVVFLVLCGQLFLKAGAGLLKCSAHSECPTNEYCFHQSFCTECTYGCQSTLTIDGKSCPPKCEPYYRCRSHHNCRTGQWCDRAHNCQPCSVSCVTSENAPPIDGLCPTSCCNAFGRSTALQRTKYLAFLPCDTFAMYSFFQQRAPYNVTKPRPCTLLTRESSQGRLWYQMMCEDLNQETCEGKKEDATASVVSSNITGVLSTFKPAYTYKSPQDSSCNLQSQFTGIFIFLAIVIPIAFVCCCIVGCQYLFKKNETFTHQPVMGKEVHVLPSSSGERPPPVICYPVMGIVVNS